MTTEMSRWHCHVDTSVTVTGSGIAGATVSIGGVNANGVFVNAMTIRATTGAHAVGIVDVVVTNPDAQTSTLTHGFTYDAGVPAPINLSAVVNGSTVTLSWSAGASALSASTEGRAAK